MATGSALDGTTIRAHQHAAGLLEALGGGAGAAVADALATVLAGKEALSSGQRPKSIALARPSRTSSARCSRSKTAAACQSRKRCQQVMPEPQPSSWGSLVQGMPVRSTKTMTTSA